MDMDIVKIGQELITFLDTPGHAAFSGIRARGAKVTDIIVLVVSVEDGIMAQSLEVIELAKQSSVPMVVALNKCDIAGQDCIRKAKESLMRAQVWLEENGGETQAVPISALTGLNVPDLLEAVNAQAELMELVADPLAPVQAHVIEARTAKGKGDVATILVIEGTLKMGDILVGGEAYCKVKSMNGMVKAGPSDPVEIIGWKGQPEIGTLLTQVATEAEANKLIDERKKVRVSVEALDAVSLAKEREKLDDSLWRIIKQEKADPSAAPRRVHSYDEVTKRARKTQVNVLIKADVIGSVEALEKAIRELPSGKVELNIVESGIGPLTQTDLELGRTANAILLAFNLPKVQQQQEQQQGLEMLQHNIIYHLMDDLEARLRRRLPPVWSETVLGQAKVLQLFPHGSSLVVGCSVTDGSLSRHPQVPSSSDEGLPPAEAFVRILRDPIIMIERARIKTMRHVKKEISQAGKGMECGVLFEGNVDAIEPGDVIQSVLRVPSLDTL